LPELAGYYALLRPAAPVAFDWTSWRAWSSIGGRRGARRSVRASTAEPIAEVAALTYGKSPDDPAIAASGVARAEAMAYRDARREGMTERDWAEIEGQLLRAYQLLKAGIGGS
jgi:hypothetical protein